jgi:hypothetical protein
MGLIWPRVKNLGQLIAMNAAIMLGIQFWFADRGGVYVLWFAPLLVLMALRPTTTELVPPVPKSNVFEFMRRKPPPNGSATSPSLAV